MENINFNSLLVIPVRRVIFALGLVVIALVVGSDSSCGIRALADGAESAAAAAVGTGREIWWKKGGGGADGVILLRGCWVLPAAQCCYSLPLLSRRLDAVVDAAWAVLKMTMYGGRSRAWHSLA